MERARMGLMRLVHAIVRSRAGGRVVQKMRTEPPGLGFSWKMQREGRERVEGGPMERARMHLGEVGAHDRPIARGGPGGAENRETEPPGLGFSWEMRRKAGEGGGGSNGEG
jgi:hypothetical protein